MQKREIKRAITSARPPRNKPSQHDSLRRGNILIGLVKSKKSPGIFGERERHLSIREAKKFVEITGEANVRKLVQLAGGIDKVKHFASYLGVWPASKLVEIVGLKALGDFIKFNQGSNELADLLDAIGPEEFKKMIFHSGNGKEIAQFYESISLRDINHLDMTYQLTMRFNAEIIGKLVRTSGGEKARNFVNKLGLEKTSRLIQMFGPTVTGHYAKHIQPDRVKAMMEVVSAKDWKMHLDKMAKTKHE